MLSDCVPLKATIANRSAEGGVRLRVPRGDELCPQARSLETAHRGRLVPIREEGRFREPPRIGARHHGRAGFERRLLVTIEMNILAVLFRMKDESQIGNGSWFLHECSWQRTEPALAGTSGTIKRS